MKANPTSQNRCLRTLSFEVMPPRSPTAAPAFWNTVRRLLDADPDFLSVTYGAGGKDKSTARHVVRELVRDTPIQPIAHLTCVGEDRSKVAHVIDDYLNAGVRTFLALRGDPPADQPEWSPGRDDVASATELVTLIRGIEEQRKERQPGAALRAAFKPLSIAVAAFPSGNPAAGTSPQQEIERLLVKQAAGASFAITQLFYEPDVYIEFVENARRYGVTIPIMAGVLPPTEPTRLHRVADLTGVSAPRHILDDLARASSEEDAYSRGIAHGRQIVRRVLDAGAPGVHVYTFNKSGPALDILRDFSELQASS
ncbi:methylenetetrahydrofolate reductase [Arcanobacterium haemolyticum]|nr:methylenetetrahydrofolate reductase [Arcanobacterium haemolyticum]